MSARENVTAPATALKREVAAEPMPGVPLAAAEILALQRTAGNHAVTTSYLLRQPTKAPPAPAKGPVNDAKRLPEAVSLEQLFALYSTNEERYTIGAMPPSQANPTYTRAWIRGAGQAAIQKEITGRLAGVDERTRIRYLNYIDNSLHPKDYDSARKLWLRDQVGAGLSLTYEQRLELRRVVGDRMLAAYTDFTAAAAANAAAIKAAANAQAAYLSLFVDVFMGLAAPGLSRGLAALANNIPANASNLTYRLALAGLDPGRTGLMLAAATKVGKDMIKIKSDALFGQTDVDLFIRELKAAYRVGIDTVNADLPNKTDDELGVLASMYDPSVSDEKTYTPKIKDLIARYQKQIQPIGPPKKTNVTDPIDRTITTQTGIVWVRRGNDTVLVEVELTQSSLDPGARMYFRLFIDRDFRDLAIEKASASQPRGVQEMPEGNITGFPGSIPANAARR